MPARRLGWPIVIIGGVLTAVLFDIGRWLIGIYLSPVALDPTLGVRSGRLLRRPAAVAVLHGADLLIRCRIHGLPRRYPRRDFARFRGSKEDRSGDKTPWQNE